MFLSDKVPIFQKLLLPASVIGGFIGLLFGPNVLGELTGRISLPVNEDFMACWSFMPGSHHLRHRGADRRDDFAMGFALFSLTSIPMGPVTWSLVAGGSTAANLGWNLFMGLAYLAVAFVGYFILKGQRDKRVHEPEV